MGNLNSWFLIYWLNKISLEFIIEIPNLGLSSFKIHTEEEEKRIK